MDSALITTLKAEFASKLDKRIEEIMFLIRKRLDEAKTRSSGLVIIYYNELRNEKEEKIPDKILFKRLSDYLVSLGLNVRHGRDFYHYLEITLI